MKGVAALVVVAGWLQLLVAALNFALPRLFDYRENLARLTPIVRQIFLVHSAYIVGVLVIFGLLCVLFPLEMTSGEPMASYLNASLALFWLVRLALQFFYYDAETRRSHPRAVTAFTLCVVYLIAVFSLAAALGISARA